ncbi:hypothetical protein V7S43_001823 [Phytophthora oleae]|uniref:Uncharacterized protein n=1 Tax=Phytophthora oleae TaxID=2107226 RepID=A0ABD3G0D4_9STRA
MELMTFSAELDEAALASLRVWSVAKSVERRFSIWWRYRISYKQSLTVLVKSTSNNGYLLQMLGSPLEHVRLSYRESRSTATIW